MSASEWCWRLVGVQHILSGALQCSVTLYLTLDLMIACVFFTKD